MLDQFELMTYHVMIHLRHNDQGKIHFEKNKMSLKVCLSLICFVTEILGNTKLSRI